MVLQRWDPFRDFRRMERFLNRFDYEFDGSNGLTSWTVPVDVMEKEDRVVIRATVPGVKPDNIDVTIEGRVLTIKGETAKQHEEKKENYIRRERRSGTFHRALRLSDTLDTEKAEPKYENGVLTITLPKLETKKAKKLNIKAA